MARVCPADDADRVLASVHEVRASAAVDVDVDESRDETMPEQIDDPVPIPRDDPRRDAFDPAGAAEDVGAREAVAEKDESVREDRHVHARVTSHLEDP